ncbi:MAG: hypothetical protein KF778_11505 [Rhodocyclaceae bacterium]|nr:hypothetical protein [Rhodocyclaceae bacterium]MBX3669021.1 hypothetical protein [Rhodocyclaceae bacterium]
MKIRKSLLAPIVVAPPKPRNPWLAAAAAGRRRGAGAHVKTRRAERRAGKIALKKFGGGEE